MMWFLFRKNKNYPRLYYETFFGTVYAMTVDQYKKINGHANSFWGWGGEDNDCLYRFIILSEFNFLDLKMFLSSLRYATHLVLESMMRAI